MSAPVGATTGTSGVCRAGWRVAVRLARREAWRRKGQTVLMLVLICLPVIAVSAAAIVWRTQDVSAAEGVERRMGAAEAVVTIPADRTPLVQGADPEAGFGWTEDSAGGPKGTLAGLRRELGPDRPRIPIHRGYSSYRTERGAADAETLEVDLGDPLAAGLVRRVEGALPTGPGEAVVNRALAERGPGIGQDLVLTPQGPSDGTTRTRTLRVVGIVESAAVRDRPFIAAPPGAFGPAQDATPSWLVGGAPLAWDDVRSLNRLGAVVTSRQVLTDPPPESALPSQARMSGGGPDETTVTVLALVAAMVLLEVVLLAGPAFAVRAKAQAHTIALVAATGGTPGQARRTVLASGVVIGAVGGVLGMALGVVVAVGAVPVVQRLSGEWFGPFEVPWPLLLLVAGFGFLSALLAAVVPAVSASRQDVVAVLAGRRGEGRSSRRSPVLGVALLGGGVAAAALGSRANASPPLVAVAALISVIGMVLVVSVVVALVGRLAGRLPLVLRFAVRDAARHRTRTVPAIAAVGATVAGVVALGIATTSDETANRQAYTPMLPDGYGSVSLATGVDPAAVHDVVERYLPGRAVEVDGVRTSTEEGELELEFRDGAEPLALSYWSTLGSPYLVGTGVPDYVDMPASERARAERVLARGGVVLVDDDAGGATPVPPVDRVTIAVSRWVPARDQPERLASVRVPSAVVRAGGTSPALAIMPPTVVEDLDLDHGAVGLVLRGPIDEQTEQDVTEELAAAAGGGTGVYVERGYRADDSTRIIQLVLAALGGVLMLGGTLTATFLALSDARPDLATMAAVGARPRTRRGIAASYALVVGLIGAVLGVPVGFIPGVAITRPLTRDAQTGATVLDVPWPLVGAVVVGLPLLTAAAVALCTRSRLPLVARVD